MRVMEELPKNANIDVVIYHGKVIIRNHAVLPINGNGSFFDSFIHILQTRNGWEVLLPQLLSQGFKIGAVIRQFIEDIKDRDKLATILETIDRDMDYNTVQNMSIPKNYLAGGKLEKMDLEIEKRLGICRNWTDLHREFKPRSDFWVELMHKMRSKTRGT